MAVAPTEARGPYIKGVGIGMAYGLTDPGARAKDFAEALTIGGGRHAAMEHDSGRTKNANAKAWQRYRLMETKVAEAKQMVTADLRAKAGQGAQFADLTDAQQHVANVLGGEAAFGFGTINGGGAAPPAAQQQQETGAGAAAGRANNSGVSRADANANADDADATKRSRTNDGATAMTEATETPPAKRQAAGQGLRPAAEEEDNEMQLLATKGFRFQPAMSRTKEKQLSALADVLVDITQDENAIKHLVEEATKISGGVLQIFVSNGKDGKNSTYTNFVKGRYDPSEGALFLTPEEFERFIQKICAEEIPSLAGHRAGNVSILIDLGSKQKPVYLGEHSPYSRFGQPVHADCSWDQGELFGIMMMTPNGAPGTVSYDLGGVKLC